jgi:hypothetical protein
MDLSYKVIFLNNVLHEIKLMDLEFVKRGQDKKKGYKIAPN